MRGDQEESRGEAGRIAERRMGNKGREGMVPGEKSWGEGEGRQGWINDPKKGVIRDT